MTPKRIPESLLVVGAIGVEFASFYSGLGAKVAVIEALPQILPAEDDEISKFARADLNDTEFLSGSPQELQSYEHQARSRRMACRDRRERRGPGRVGRRCSRRRRGRPGKYR